MKTTKKINFHHYSFTIGTLFLVLSLVLSLVSPFASDVQAAPGNPGDIQTTDVGCVAQNKNHYAVGEAVYLRGKNFPTNEKLGYSIDAQPGSGNMGGIHITGGLIDSDANGEFCAHIHTIQPGEYGEFKVGVDYAKKSDDYRVIGAQPTVTTTPPPTMTTPPPEETTPAPTETTPPPPAETTPAPAETTPPPPEETTPAPTETTPPPDETTPPPTISTETPTVQPTEDVKTPTPLPPTPVATTLIPPVETQVPPTETQVPATETEVAPTQESTVLATETSTAGGGETETTDLQEQIAPTSEALIPVTGISTVAAPAASVRSGTVLIPVTGEGDASPFKTASDILSTLGFALIGLGLVLKGLTRLH